MQLKYPLTSYLYHYGLHAGLPYGMLRWIGNLRDILKRPLDFIARQRHAKSLLRDSKWRGFLPRDKGCRSFGPGVIPELDRLVEIGQKLYTDRADEHDQLRETDGKSPITHLLRDEDLSAGSEIVDIAICRPLIEIVTDYFSSVPKLDNIDLWVSRPNESDVGSQLYHLDKPDRHFLRLFVHVSDVTPENGPLTYFPADESLKIRKATGYDKHYYHGSGRLSDEALFAIIPRSAAVELIGPRGTGGFVDASECLHFGSRCKQGQRIVFVITYLPGHKIGTSQISSIANRRHDSELNSLILCP